LSYIKNTSKEEKLTSLIAKLYGYSKASVKQEVKALNTADNIVIRENQTTAFGQNNDLASKMYALLKNMETAKFLVFVDAHSALYYCYDLEKDEYKTFLKKETLQAYINMKGYDMPKVLPSLISVYDPTDFIKLNDTTYTINLFTPTEYMYIRPNGRQINLEQECPYIWKVLTNLISPKYNPNFNECIKWFLNWLAASFQSRTKRQVAPVFIGAQGTGKNLFYELVLTPFYGQNNVHLVENKDIDSQFNGQWENKMLLVLNEVAPNRNERSQVQSKLKSLVTEQTININEKFLKARNAINFANIIMFSNLGTPINIEIGDRRYCVFRTGDAFKKIDPNWSYVEYQDNINKELVTFYQYLINLDVDYQKADSIINTEARSSAIENSISQFDMFVSRLDTADEDWFNASQTACYQKSTSLTPPALVAYTEEEYKNKTYDKIKTYRMFLNCFPDQRLSVHKLTSMLKASGYHVKRAGDGSYYYSR
jgi:hypothetical protein